MKKKLDFLRSTAFMLSLLAGSSYYGYVNRNDIYDSIRHDTVSKVQSDFESYKPSGDCIDPITAYNGFVSNIAAFFKDELKVKDLNQIFMIFTYMMYKGYFSIDKHFEYGLPDFEVYGCKGLSILFGSGVCEHQTYLFNDVLSAMGYENYVVVCSLDDDKADGIYSLIDSETGAVYMDQLVYISGFNDFRETFMYPWFLLFDDHPTHIFNAVVLSDEVYYFDVTNLLKWNYVGDGKWSSLVPEPDKSFDARARYSKNCTLNYNDIGNLLSYRTNCELEACYDVYDALMLGDFEMLFEYWYRSIPVEVFDGVKTINNYNKIRRKCYD